jgi:hypothetical protein
VRGDLSILQAASSADTSRCETPAEAAEAVARAIRAVAAAMGHDPESEIAVAADGDEIRLRWDNGPLYWAVPAARFCESQNRWWSCEPASGTELIFRSR